MPVEFPKVEIPARFRHVPLHTSSAGQDCIDLAAHAGLHLDDWQQDLIMGALTRKGGRWAPQRVGVVVPRQNGKGGILEARQLWGLYLNPKDRLQTHTAHRFDTSIDHFRRIVSLIEDTPDLLAEVRDNGRGVGDRPSGIKDSNGKESIELRDKSRLVFKARAKGAGRGFSGDAVYFDEAFWLQELGSLVPSLSAREDPQVWFVSSAPLDEPYSDSLRKIIRAGRSDEPGRLAYFEWSAPVGSDLDDRAALRMANPSMAVGRITEEYTYEVERGLLTDVEFGRERLGIFNELDEGPKWEIFPEAVWRSAEGTAPLLDPVTLAVEIAQDFAWSCIVAAGDTGNGEAIEPIDMRDGTDWLVERLVELDEAHGIRGVVIDRRSAVAALIEDMEAAGLTIIEPKPQDVMAAAGALYVGTVGGVVAHPAGCAWLDAAAGHAAKRVYGDAWLIDRRVKQPVGPLIAASLALWGHRRPVEEQGGVSAYEHHDLMTV